VRQLAIVLGLLLPLFGQEKQIDIRQTAANPLTHSWFKRPADCPNVVGGSNISAVFDFPPVIDIVEAKFSRTVNADEDLEVQLKIKNVSSKDLLLPWSTDVSRFDRPGSGLVSFSTLRLRVREQELEGWQKESNAILYGAQDVPDTLLMVKSQETVIIRFKVNLDQASKPKRMVIRDRVAAVLSVSAQVSIRQEAYDVQRCAIHYSSLSKGGATSFPSAIIEVKSKHD
jgi:hypothetical protein